MEYAVYLDIGIIVNARSKQEAAKKARKKFEIMFEGERLLAERAGFKEDLEKYLIEPLE